MSQYHHLTILERERIFLLQGFSGGLYTIFFSVVAGCIYLLCQKDIRWTYLFVAIAFIL